jgi:prepilin-type N-terminal cleavage/methylation domain-containing protein/prepilin-type processing-associated H-X9-DG protein
MEKYRKKTGFTLIELLVVIAIIALLLGILTPALSKVKRSAQTLICATNLKNYGPALQMYSQDNDDKAPFMVSWLFSQNTIANASFVTKGCMWHNDRDVPDGSMWPYLSSKDVHLCPTFKNYAIRGGKDGCPSASVHSMLTPFGPTYSYSMNWFLGFDWATLMDFDRQKLPNASTMMYEREISMKLSRVKSAGQCFAFSEENLWAIDHRMDDRDMYYSANVLNDNALWLNANKTKPDGATDNVATYHGVTDANKNEGVANILFVDGHVEAMKGSAGREAYLKYGKPYPGHEKMNVW